MKQSIKRIYDARRSPYWILAGVFVFFCILGWILPYMHDDWAWGSSIGLGRLERLFENYNGRWAGNLLVLVLTRFRLLRALAYGASLAVIALYAWKLTGGKRTGLLFGIALILCVPHAMFGQAIAWTSGFVNYTVSVAMLLPLVYWGMERIFQKEPKKPALWSVIGAGVLCFAVQLFMEHITLYLLAFLLFANLVWLIRRKKPDLFLGVLFGAAAAGAALMFSNEAYRSAAANPGGYQQIATGSLSAIIGRALDQYFDKIIVYFLLDNLILMIALSVFCLIALQVYKPRGHVFPALVIGVTLLYEVTRKWIPINLTENYLGRRILGVVCFFYVLSVVYAIWSVREVRWKGLVLFGSAFVLTAPLLIVEPIGPRNFFVVYVFLTLVCMLLCAELLKQVKNKDWRRAAGKVAAGVCMTCAVFYLVIFSEVSLADRQRLRSVEEQAARGNQTILLEPLPYGEYMHCSSPINERFEERFRRFYRLPDGVKITVVEEK